jgi:hypothetical protein
MSFIFSIERPSRYIHGVCDYDVWKVYDKCYNSQNKVLDATFQNEHKYSKLQSDLDMAIEGLEKLRVEKLEMLLI